ncbi:pirin family protein [Aurantivibrio infirmus]
MEYFRSADSRGRADVDWLDSRHTFSFGSYYDPEHMGFGALRVINEDRIVPGGGFDTHGHKDMEIISYVISGALAHKDSIGNGSQIKPGEVQKMSAGSGIEHSEFNASKTEPVHFLQIWIRPNRVGIDPSYEQVYFAPEERQNTLKLIVSGSGREGAIKISQDVEIYSAVLDVNKHLKFDVATDRKVWVQVVKGELIINSVKLAAGDGLGLEKISEVSLASTSDAEILLFDLAIQK